MYITLDVAHALMDERIRTHLPTPNRRLVRHLEQKSRR